MSRPLNEEQVLKKLKIEDFRHLTKDQVVDLVKMQDKMDPEVFKAAISQIPQFSENVRLMLEDSITFAQGILDKTDIEALEFSNHVNQLNSSLSAMLEDDSYTFEQKIQIMDRMSEILKMEADYKKRLAHERTNLAVGIFGLAASAITAVAGIVGIAINNKHDKNN